MTKEEKAITGLENLRDAIREDYIRETDQAIRTIDDALELLKEQPQQKKTGKWVGEEYWYMCSECQFDCPHFIRDWNYEQVRTEYCPHCGAKMENCQ